MRQGKTSGQFPFRSVFSVHSKPIKEPKPRIPAILISRQCGGIGDMLMLTPTIRAIKESNPDIPLIVCTSPRYGVTGVLFDLLKNNPYVDKTISVEELIDYDFKKFYNFGTGAECGIEAETDRNRIDIFAELGGVELKDKQTVYVVTDREKEWARKWIPHGKKLIGIQIHTSTAKRNWPEQKSLLLAHKVVDTWKDTAVLLFYEGLIEVKTEPYPNIYTVIGLPIRLVAALINECQVLIAPDSGLLHIAGALKVKTIGLFGSTPPMSRISCYPKASVIVGYCPSGPCWYGKCGRGFECMDAITVRSVIGKMKNEKERITYVKAKPKNVKVVKQLFPFCNAPLKSNVEAVYDMRHDRIGDGIGVIPILKYMQKSLKKLSVIYDSKTGDIEHSWQGGINLFEWTDFKPYKVYKQPLKLRPTVTIFNSITNMSVWDTLGLNDLYPEMRVPKAFKNVDEFLGIKPTDKVITTHVLNAVNVGVRNTYYVTRRVLNMDKYEKIALELCDRGYKVIRLGAYYDKVRLFKEPVIDLTERDLPLEWSFSILARSCLFYGGDTGLKLAGSALGVPIAVEIDPVSKSFVYNLKYRSYFGCKPDLLTEIPYNCSFVEHMKLLDKILEVL